MVVTTELTSVVLAQAHQSSLGHFGCGSVKIITLLCDGLVVPEEGQFN